MATIYIPFKPGGVAPPQFYVEFDAVYSMTVKWNVSAQRYYFDLYDPYGTWVVTLPLISTAANIPIAAWAYDPLQRAMRFTLSRPWFRPVGQMIDITVAGVDPTVLNGVKRCEVINEFDRQFPLALDPGQIVTLGSKNVYNNLIEGYIPGWVMIFRNNQFEISPATGG